MIYIHINLWDFLINSPLLGRYFKLLWEKENFLLIAVYSNRLIDLYSGHSFLLRY